MFECQSCGRRFPEPAYHDEAREYWGRTEYETVAGCPDCGGGCIEIDDPEEEGREPEIRVCVIEPGKAPRFRTIANELEPLQELVGGWIECVYMGDDTVAVCNEEGLLRGLPQNRRIAGVDFVGTVVMAKRQGPELASLDEEGFRESFPELWRAEL